MARAMSFREEPFVTAGVIGAGPVGLLAAMALGARGLAVWLHSIEPADHPRATLAEQIGARYVRSLDLQADIMVEPTGAAAAAFAAIRCAGPVRGCSVLWAFAAQGHVAL